MTNIIAIAAIVTTTFTTNWTTYHEVPPKPRAAGIYTAEIRYGKAYQIATIDEVKLATFDFCGQSNQMVIETKTVVPEPPITREVLVPEIGTSLYFTNHYTPTNVFFYENTLPKEEIEQIKEVLK